MCSENVARNADKYQLIAKVSVQYSLLGLPNPRMVSEL